MAELNLNADLNDLFIELATMGLGRAAAAMSALASREVKISAPSMEVFSVQNREVRLALETGTTLRVSQAIKGGLHGQAVVVLSKAGRAGSPSSSWRRPTRAATPSTRPTRPPSSSSATS